MKKFMLFLLLVSLGISRVHSYPDRSRPPPRSGPPPPQPGMQDDGSRPRPPPPGPGQFGDQGDYDDPKGHTGGDFEYSYENVPTDAPSPRLDGGLGSVCTRKVKELVHSARTVHYPCWHEDQVPCYMCGLKCRIYGNTCFKQTRQACPQHENRYKPQVVDHTYCCPGYEQLGDFCHQVVSSSACDYNNGGCDQLCLNSGPADSGSDRAKCECFNGYRLVSGTRCEDINECASANGGCNQGCSNTPGSFVCTCTDGYRLQDPLTCQEVDECSVNNGGCAHMCQNTRGSFYCQCDTGFKRVRDFECHAIDQCSLYYPCSHTCVSLPGRYACGCPRGMQLDGPYGRNCIETEDDVLSTGADGTQPNHPKPDDISDYDRNAANSRAGEMPANTQMAVIVGAVVGSLFLIFCITVAVCLTRRSQASSTSARGRGTPGPTHSHNRDDQYESTVHHNGQHSRPPKYDNNAYDGLIPSSIAKGPVVPPRGAVDNDYLEVLPPPPPYSVAPPVPKEAYMIPTSGSPSTDSVLYEVLDYGAASPVYDNKSHLKSPGDDRPPPLPPSPRPSGTRALPTAPVEGKTVVTQLNDHQLATARHKLKKHAKK